MQRLTAKLLLVLSLVGVFAPAALVLSAPPAHACCLRKPLHNHTSHRAQFQAVDCCHHNCCRPLTVARWAQPRPAIHALAVEQPVIQISESRRIHGTLQFVSSHSVRGPPAT